MEKRSEKHKRDRINKKAFHNLIVNLSTYAILFTLLLYFIGVILKISITSDDFILSDIKSQLPKNTIIKEIKSVDLHGFGNNSFVITAVNDKKNFDQKQSSINLLCIFDKVDDSFFKKIYKPFGIGSSYILKYKFSLDDVPPFSNEISSLEFVELTGDPFVEVVTSWKSQGASDGVDTPIIISWVNGEYRFIGSIPSGYDDYLSDHKELTKVEPSYESINSNYFNTKDRNYSNGIMSSFHWFFKDVDHDNAKELIVYSWEWGEKEGRSSPHFYRTDVYKSTYNDSNQLLEWSLLDSISTKEKLDGDSNSILNKLLESRIPIY